MSKTLKEFLNEEKEAEEAAARPPATSAKSSEAGAMPEIDSSRSDPSMKLSDFTADDSVCFELERLKEISEASEKNMKLKQEEKGATLTVDSTKSEEVSGTSKKSERAELAKKHPILPEMSTGMCVTPPSAGEAKKSVNQTTSLLMSHQGMRESAFHALNVKSSKESSAAMEAWERLKKSDVYVYYGGKPVGTLAAMDPTAEAVDHNQVLVRDFVPTGLACLMNVPAEPEIVLTFLLETLLHLQGPEKMADIFTLGEGILPASFKVSNDSDRAKETIVADFGRTAIGRVAPVDSGFWWITYDTCTTRDTFPTLLCADGCSMIDRQMGINGDTTEIPAVFYFELRGAMQLSKPECEGMEVLERIALFWPLTSKTGRSLIAQRAIELAAQATGGTLPAASTPAPQEGGANGPSAAKRKREASDEASRVNRRRIEEEDLKLVWEAILGNLHGDIGMEVYWVDIFDVAELLGRVEGVEVMENFLQLETSVAAVLVQNQRSITTPKVYFSLWTSQRLVELSIATTPWPRFRVEVRGVHVYEQPGDEIEVAENEVEEGEEEEEAAEGVHGHEQAGEEAEAAEGVHGHEQAGEEAEAAEGVHGHEQAGNEVKEEAGENVEEEVEAAEGVHGHKQAGNEVKEEAAEKVEEEAE